jgi:serine/threonine protein phosphatase PrpC
LHQLAKIWPFSWFVRLFGSKTVRAPAAPALPSVPPAWGPEVASEHDDDVTQLHLPRNVPSAAPPALADALFEPEHDTAVDTKIVLTGAPLAKSDPARAGTLRLLAFGDGDTGKRRRQNEDSLLQLPEHGVYAVADGMGAAGQLASTVAVNALRESFDLRDFSEDVRADPAVPLAATELARAVARANRLVRQAADEVSLGGKTGTTLLAARFTPADGRLYLAHVGDSRCYRLRGSELVCLTTDQTMRLAGLRGPGANDLLQAVGITRSLQIDLLVEEPHAGDTYLMCSDGLPKMLDTLELAEVLAEEPDAEATVYALIERANDRGGKDNVSAIVLRFAAEERAHSATIPRQAQPELPASPSTRSPERPSLRWLMDGVSRESGAFRTDLGALDDDATTIARVPYDKSKRA